MLTAIPGAQLITPQEARGRIEPLLKPHLPAGDLALVLDREFSLDDEYDRRSVLILPDGAEVPGDLVLDHDQSPFDSSGWRGILALGDLMVAGDILGENTDGGPFLVTAGTLSVRHIIKAGAPLAVCGRLTASGHIYCHYNHGSFRALGGLKAAGLIIDDQLFQLEGPVEAASFIFGVDDPEERLHPDLMWETEESCSEVMDDVSDEIIARIKSGQPVLREKAA